MDSRPLGKTGLRVAPIGFGAFKIGRNEKTKYAETYALPTDAESDRLLNAILDLGINLIDTAPAYGLSEDRIGRALAHRRKEIVLSTKVGEQFEAGQSTYDFSEAAIRTSIEQSLARLSTDVLDLVCVHARFPDLEIVRDLPALATLADLKRRGVIRAVGFSGKTPEAALAALPLVDVLMIEYHVEDDSHADVIRRAAAAGVGVVVKKGLASGRIRPEVAIPYVLSNPGVCALVIGGLSIDHMRRNVELAASTCESPVNQPKRPDRS